MSHLVTIKRGLLILKTLGGNRDRSTGSWGPIFLSSFFESERQLTVVEFISVYMTTVMYGVDFL